MGVRILEGSEPGNDRELACLFCSVTDWAFGPVFRGRGELSAADEAEKFDQFCQGRGKDPRALTSAQLEWWYAEFVDQLDKSAAEAVTK